MRVETLLVLAELYRDIGSIVQWVHDCSGQRACHDSIKAEAAENGASDQISSVREVAPGTEKWDKVDYTETYSTYHSVYEEEEGEARGKLGTVDG